MSADNTIAIGEFPTSNGGKEFRVIEAGAIENVDYGTPEEQDHMRVRYFGNAPSFATHEEALKKAIEIEKDFTDNGWFVEYGIVDFKFDRPLLNETEEEAMAWLDKRVYGKED